MLPEEVTKFIGQRGDVTIMEIEKGAIRRFADAVGDENPLFRDEEYARNSRYGSIIAPPGFFGWPIGKEGGVSSTALGGGLADALAKVGYSRVLDGGTEYDFFLPVRAGDTLAASSITKDIIERGTEDRRMAFTITETTYTNQNGDVVAKARGTLIRR